MNDLILIITNKEDFTVDYIVRQLQRDDTPYYRFNTEDIGTLIDVDFDGNDYQITDHRKDFTLALKNVSAVYFRRPSLPEYTANLSPGEKAFLMREAECLLEGMYRHLQDRFWLNNVFDIRWLENKPFQLKLAKEIGLPVPPFCISTDTEKCRSFIKQHEKVIFKPLKTGFIDEGKERLGKILYTTRVDKKFISELDSLSDIPIYLQQEIDKECDVRVTVVGNEAFAAKIFSQEAAESETDWRKSNDIPRHEAYELPDNIREKCLELCSMANLKFAAIDLILDKAGNSWFLEINPNGQWVWIELLLEYPIIQRIGRLLKQGNKGT